MPMYMSEQSENVEVALSDRTFAIFMMLLSFVSLYFNYSSNHFISAYGILKWGGGIIMIVSEVILIVLSWRSFRYYSDDLGRAVKVFLILILLYNSAHIVYASFFDEDVAFMSLFGNNVFQPAFMLPLFFAVGMDINRIPVLFRAVLYYTMLMIPIFFLTQRVNVFVGMGLLFLLAFLNYFPKGWRIILFVLSIAYIVYCYYDDARVPIIRVLMGLAIFVFSLTPMYKSKMIRIVLFVGIIAIPLYFLALFVTTGYSVFENSDTSRRVSQMGVEHTGDTRTFLYEEVIEDLNESDSWIFGKGINGTYYSSSFDLKNASEHAYNRMLAEAGFLDFMLKGGLVQTILYELILILAIFNCFFKANSKAMVLIGSVLLAHYVLLFVEDIPMYDIYNAVMWLFVGMAFSPGLLDSDDSFFEERFQHVFHR